MCLQKCVDPCRSRRFPTGTSDADNTVGKEGVEKRSLGLHFFAEPERQSDVRIVDGDILITDDDVALSDERIIMAAELEFDRPGNLFQGRLQFIRHLQIGDGHPGSLLEKPVRRGNASA